MWSSSRTPRLLVSSLLLFTTAGCHTWESVRLEENLNPESRPAEIQLRLKNGQKLAIEHPLIRGDSLYGLTVTERDLTTGRITYSKETAVPLADIKDARAAQLNGPRTAVLFVLTPIAALGALVLAFAVFGGPTLGPSF